MGSWRKNIELVETKSTIRVIDVVRSFQERLPCLSPAPHRLLQRVWHVQEHLRASVSRLWALSIVMARTLCLEVVKLVVKQSARSMDYPILLVMVS